MVQWNGHFSIRQLSDQDKWSTFCFFKTFLVGPNRSTEFWTEISGNFG